MSRRCLKMALRSVMKSRLPDSAATEAACDTELGFEVDCDCRIAIALMSATGPPA